MNSFVKMLSGLKSWMYRMMKAGFSMPVAGATGKTINVEKLNIASASKSKRVMRKEWGMQPELIGIRRIDRNSDVHIKRFKPSLIGVNKNAS